MSFRVKDVCEELGKRKWCCCFCSWCFLQSLSSRKQLVGWNYKTIVISLQSY